MKNKIVDLRNHLFAALEGLADEDNPMDVVRARAISDVAQTIINSAKAELDFHKHHKVLVDEVQSDFIPVEKDITPARPQLKAIAS